MTENEQKSLSRRSVTHAAAWSVPTVALAIATPAAAASITAWDLSPSFTNALTLDITLNLGISTVTLAEVSLFGQLTIGNLGTEASPAGQTASLVYDAALLTLNITGPGVSVIGTGGTRTLTLPSIPGGGSLQINLSPTLVRSGILNLGVGQRSSSIAATVNAVDGNTGNNSATGNVGITVLRLS